MEKISRKDFVRLFVAFSSLAVVGEAGCSGDDADAGSSSGGSSGSGSSSSSSSSGGASSSSGGSTSSSSSSGGASSSGGTDSGADSDAGTDSGGGANACTTDKTYNESNGIISGHPHTLMIPAADFAGNVDKTYPVTQSTPHTVTITAADFATLRAGGTVTVTTSKDGNHTHKCTLKC